MFWKKPLRKHEIMTLRLFKNGSVELHVRQGIHPQWIRDVLETATNYIEREYNSEREAS